MESGNHTTQNSKDEITLKELFLKIHYWFKYLVSKWYLLAAVGIIGGVLGFMYAKSKKPSYTAITTFVLESSEGAGGGALSQYAGVASMMGIDLGGTNGNIFQGDNLLEFYKSRKMLEATLLKVSPSDTSKLLIDTYLSLGKKDVKSQNENKLIVDFKKKFSGNELRLRDSIMSRVIGEITKNHLKVDKLDKKLSILKVEVTSNDEIFSKEFNEALVREVNDFYVQTKIKKSVDNIKILQYKADSVRAVMNGAISRAAVVADATPNMNPTRLAQRAIPTQLSQFSAETNKAILGQLVQNLELAKMTSLREAPLIEIIDEPKFPLSKTQVGKIKFAIVGAVFFVFIATLVLIVKRSFALILAE